MWDKLLAGLAALLTAALPYLEKIGLVAAGAKLRDGANAQAELNAIARADDAARAVDAADDAGLQRLRDKWK